VDENSATAVDELTVDIKTTQPNAQLPGQIAHPNFGIRAPGSDPFAGEHIGTGRFMLEEYVPDDHITVVKNPNYWGEAPLVDQIVFRFIPDPNTRVLALQGHEVDVIYDVPREAAVTLEGLDDVQLINAPVGAYQAVSILSTGQPPYDIGTDPLVREAIAYAIDRQAVIDTAFDGFAEPVQTLIPPAVLGDNAGAVTGYSHDPDRAMSLLEEAGWVDSDGDGIREKDGRTLTLEIVSGFPTANDNGQTPEVIQAQLAEVGIETTITAINDDIAYDERLTAQQGDLWVEIGNQNSASPCFLPFFLYYGGNAEPNNYQLAFAPTFAGTEGFDEEMEACTAAFDPAESAVHAANAMHILIDQARTALPLLGLYRIWGTGSNVSGFEAHPIFAMIQWDQVTVGE
jgi:peptide/nickel transport system substrate-binding protein